MKRSHKPDGKGLPADFREIVGRLRRKEPELEHMTGNGPDRKAAGLVSRLRAKGYTAGQIAALTGGGNAVPSNGVVGKGES